MDDRRQEDGPQPVFEEPRTRHDRTTELVATPPPHRQQQTRTPSEDEYEIIPFSQVPDEKLRLLERLVAGGQLALGGAKLEVELREKRIRVGGTADQIETARTKAHEVLSRVCCDAVGISQSQLQLVMCERGQRWFDDFLVQNGGRVVVLFTRDEDGYIAGEDDDSVSHAKSVLHKSLATETISFGAEVSKFLQSRRWTDAVEKYESKWLVGVTCDCDAGAVLVDGCVQAVDDVAANVRQLLQQNSTASRTIQLKPAEYRLIEQHLRAEISQCLKNQQG